MWYFCSVFFLAFFIGYDTYNIQLTAAELDMQDVEQDVLQDVGPIYAGNEVADVAPASEQSSLDGRLSDAMQNKKLFLRSDLSLDDLAKALHTNRTYLSKLINAKYNCSFSTFVNRFRVDYAKHLLLNERDSTLEWVAIKSGFVSYNSFFHTFKEFEGVSPGFWRKVHKTMS